MAKGVDPALIGRTIGGKFTIESYIGAGAMGAVYRAKQVALDKVVALKVLHRELATDDAFTSRFKREAKAASRLDHPNSVRVIDSGVEPDGAMYIAMELLLGRDLLRVLVEDWPLSAPRIAGVLMQALAALSVAHDMGVIHRDLKPENIMILEGTDDDGQKTDIVKVCDFGIAKLTALRSENISQVGGPLTGQGLVVGTPEYMSPEQGRSDTLDLRSDLYSIGVILYQLLTGRVPFDAESALGIVFKHVTEEPVRPSVINPTVDRRLEAVCLKAMSKRREDRHQTAREMRAELRSRPGLEHLRSISGSPSVTRLATDDTAPMPLMTRDRSARALPDAEDEGPDPFANAATAPSVPARPDRLPKTTSSVTALYDQAPRASRAPPPALVAFALVALGAVLVAAFVVHRATSGAAGDRGAGARDPRAALPPGVAAAEPSAAAAGGQRGERVVASGSPAPALEALFLPRAPRPPPGGARSPRPDDLRPRSPVRPPRASGAFDLATASANPERRARRGSLRAGDVRAALPSAHFTQCYREGAHAHGRARLSGSMSVHVVMGGDGRVTTALVSCARVAREGHRQLHHGDVQPPPDRQRRRVRRRRRHHPRVRPGLTGLRGARLLLLLVRRRVEILREVAEDHLVERFLADEILAEDRAPARPACWPPKAAAGRVPALGGGTVPGATGRAA